MVKLKIKQMKLKNDKIELMKNTQNMKQLLLILIIWYIYNIYMYIYIYIIYIPNNK